MQQAEIQGTGGFESLGTGRSDDRLGFRLVVQILLRCLPLLRGLWRHLAALMVGWTTLGLVGILGGLALISIWWNSVLGDTPLSPSQSGLLGFDVTASPGTGAALDAGARRSIKFRALVYGIALTPPLAVVGMALYYYQVWILQHINQTLRVQLLDRLQALSLRFHAGSRVGDAIYRTYQDSSTVTQLVHVLFLTPLGAIARYVAGISIAAMYDPWMALALAAVWPPTLALGLGISWRMRVGFRGARETNSALTSRIQESVAGIRVIKAYGLERFEQERFERDSRTAFDAAFRARNRLAFFGVAIYWIVAVGTLSATARATLLARDTDPTFLSGLAAGSGGWLEGALIAAGFTIWNLGLYNGFKFAFGQATGATEGLYRLWGRVQDIAIGLDRVFEVLDMEPEVNDPPGAEPMPPLQSSIAFEDVRFAYQADRPVLDGISLEAKTGTVTAVVGPTGAGKSTLMALLLRLFDPEQGRITIDGRDIRELQTASLRAHVSIALQENILFGTTVRENIRYAVPGADDEAVRLAARVACADAFVEQLPDGYDTLLGERGAKLSTGQRQRISIARAVCKDTPVLILDEPTASLDAETELSMLRNLARWGHGRIIFLITHRLSTIRRSDQIVYLDEGRVVESGSHQDLMRTQGGAYRRLIEAEESGLAADVTGGGA